MDLLQNPIKVHIVRNNVITTTHLFVGDIPANIVAEIKKVYSTNGRSTKLEEYYGKSRKRKLGLEEKTGGNPENPGIVTGKQ